jgi:hypothetical protein
MPALIPRVPPPSGLDLEQRDGLLSPTRTLASLISRVLPRQNTAATALVSIPGSYGGLNSSPDPGTVAGIVLGSVGGFLLLLWLIYLCVNFGNPDTASSYGTASIATRRSRRSSHRHHHKPPVRLRATETVEVRTRERGSGSHGHGGGPIIVDAAPSVERVHIVEERRSSRVPPPPPRVVDSSDDEVVVIEENSPPRRRRSSAGRRSEDRRRESGYREVDPERFAGGDAPLRDVSRRGSRRRS